MNEKSGGKKTIWLSQVSGFACTIFNLWSATPQQNNEQPWNHGTRTWSLLLSWVAFMAKSAPKRIELQANSWVKINWPVSYSAASKLAKGPCSKQTACNFSKGLWQQEKAIPCSPSPPYFGLLSTDWWQRYTVGEDPMLDYVKHQLKGGMHSIAQGQCVVCPNFCKSAQLQR